MTSTLTAVQVTGWQARISWTPDPDDEGAGAAETVSLSRVVDGVEYPVMGAQNTPNIPDVWDDPEAPLGKSVVYRMTGGPGSTSIDAAPVTVAGPPIPGMGGAPGAVLSDPLRAMSVPVIVLEEHLPTARKTRASAIDVEGQAQRVVITHVEGAATRQPQWLTETIAQADVVDDLLSPGTAVLLRASCDVVPDEWLQPVGDRSVEPLSGTSPARKHTLGETQILDSNPAIGQRATGDTLGDLDQLIDATLEDISTYPGWSTLGDIAATDIRGLLA